MAHMSRANRLQMYKLLAELVQNGTGLLSTSHPVQWCVRSGSLGTRWCCETPASLNNSIPIAKMPVFSTPKCGFPSEGRLQYCYNLFCDSVEFMHKLSFPWLAIIIYRSSDVSRGHCWQELIQFHSEFYVIEVKKLEAHSIRRRTRKWQGDNMGQCQSRIYIHDSWPFMYHCEPTWSAGDIHLSGHPSIQHLSSIYPASIHLSIHPYITHLSIYPSTYPPTHLSVSPIHLSTYLFVLLAFFMSFLSFFISLSMYIYYNIYIVYIYIYVYII